MFSKLQSKINGPFVKAWSIVVCLIWNGYSSFASSDSLSFLENKGISISEKFKRTKAFVERQQTGDLFLGTKAAFKLLELAQSPMDSAIANF